MIKLGSKTKTIDGQSISRTHEGKSVGQFMLIRIQKMVM